MLPLFTELSARLIIDVSIARMADCRKLQVVIHETKRMGNNNENKESCGHSCSQVRIIVFFLFMEELPVADTALCVNKIFDTV